MKRGNDWLKNIFKLTRFAFEVRQKFEAFPGPREYKSFLNLSGTQLKYNKYLTNLIFSVRTVSYGSSFFPLRFMTRALRAWAINRKGKNSVRNLQCEPRTWLVRGIYVRPCVILFFCSLCLYDTKKHFCTGLHLLMIYGMGNPEWGNMGL